MLLLRLLGIVIKIYNLLNKTHFSENKGQNNASLHFELKFKQEKKNLFLNCLKKVSIKINK